MILSGKNTNVNQGGRRGGGLMSPALDLLFHWCVHLWCKCCAGQGGLLLPASHLTLAFPLKQEHFSAHAGNAECLRYSSDYHWPTRMNEWKSN